MLEVDTRRQNVTAPVVTITLDAETCFILSEALMELGRALSTARRRHLSVKRYKGITLPRNLEILGRKRARIKQRLVEIGNPPLRAAVKALREEFGETWDGLEFLISDIRREERHAAREDRDRQVLKLKGEGLTVKAIAGRSGLSQGTVRNILSRLKKTSVPPPVVEARAV